MKISEQWLREWVAVREGAKALAERLTLAGLEVGSVVRVAPSTLDRIVVGEILSLAPHPQADRLRVCQVNIGQKKSLTIVCGAANAAAGLKVPAALAGATLPNGTKIAVSAIRGVESSGMLCSAAELGLEETSQGLLTLDASAKPGMSLTKYLALDDHQIEIELTPNRGDCLSIAGLAREISALTGARHTPVRIRPVQAKARRKLAITLSAKAACARYAGRMIEDINPQAVTPMWMKERLRRGGVRSIHPVVDITNYVMLELGQPMHAFDIDRLAGELKVRMARKGDSLTLLDGRQLSLDPADLVIADSKGPVALAGIMGGQDSAVGGMTRNVFLESAWFRPEAVGVRARHYGLHSESSHRFERGVDPDLQRDALERATGLLLAICGGRAGPVSEMVSRTHLPKPPRIELRAARIERVLGMAMPAMSVESTLKRLGMQVTRVARRRDGHAWKVTPPSWRSDLAIEVDLIEELVRVQGYDTVPARMPTTTLAMRPLPETRITESRLRTLLVDRDYQEAITYAFVDPALQALITPEVHALALANPIASDMAQMRTTLWPGLIKATLHNRNRQQDRVRLFEIGRRFLPKAAGGVDEQPVLAGIATGAAFPEQWGTKPRPVDFFDIKGDIEALLALGGHGPVIFRAARHTALHPGRSAEVISSDGQAIGLIGELHPEILKKTGLEGTVILFELEFGLLRTTVVPKFREISRFPAVRRDLAVIVREEVAAQAILDCVRSATGAFLVNLELFDEYRGEGIDSGRKSLALGLTFQDTSRTLNDRDVEVAVERVVTALGTQFDAQLRQ